MKLLKNIFAILLVTLFTVSCGGDDDNETSQTTPTPIAPTTGAFMKAKIDGVDYNADAIRVLAGFTTDKITVSSVLADNRNFEIVLNYITEAGTYTIPTPADKAYSLKLVYGEGNVSSSLFSAGACTGTTGTLVITSLTGGKIAGTFSFTAKKAGGCSAAPRAITEGSFRAQLVKD